MFRGSETRLCCMMGFNRFPLTGIDIDGGGAGDYCQVKNNGFGKRMLVAGGQRVSSVV